MVGVQVRDQFFCLFDLLRGCKRVEDGQRPWVSEEGVALLTLPKSLKTLEMTGFLRPFNWVLFFENQRHSDDIGDWRP